jgi:uncharacterized nucleotidyltransferase DUF6036
VTRQQLEHVIHAAAEVTGETEIVVVGSQAILGRFPDAPPTLLVSQEADVFPRRRAQLADDIDGALGDGSPFHQTYGYYAHGVGPETAKAPKGWERRLVEVRVPRRPSGSGHVTGLCLEPHDLVLAKCAAGRERDWEFVREAIAHELVDPAELLGRTSDLPLPVAERRRVTTMLRGIVGRT